MVVIFQALVGCHDILILGKSPIKWRQRPDMTLAVDWDVKHQLKQTNKHPDESKTRTNRFSKLPDDGDPWAPNNLLTLEQKKNISWTQQAFLGILVPNRLKKCEQPPKWILV